MEVDAASSTLSRKLSLFFPFWLPRSFSPHTSTGSNTPTSIISIPRFWNRAILASVPASTMTFVITLCAWRLYKGIIVLRPPEEEEDAVLNVKDAVDANEDVEALLVLALLVVALVGGVSLTIYTSDLLEFVRTSEVVPVLPSVALLLVRLLAEVGVMASSWLETPVGGLPCGGTSWTWRFSGWLDLDGGGRTNMNVCLWKVEETKKRGGWLVIMAIMVITVERREVEKGQAGRVHIPFRASRMTIRELGRQ